VAVFGLGAVGLACIQVGEDSTLFVELGVFRYDCKNAIITVESDSIINYFNRTIFLTF
jgi:hypothetical protein